MHQLFPQVRGTEGSIGEGSKEMKIPQIGAPGTPYCSTVETIFIKEMAPMRCLFRSFHQHLRMAPLYLFNNSSSFALISMKGIIWPHAVFFCWKLSSWSFREIWQMNLRFSYTSVSILLDRKKIKFFLIQCQHSRVIFLHIYRENNDPPASSFPVWFVGYPSWIHLSVPEVFSSCSRFKCPLIMKRGWLMRLIPQRHSCSHFWWWEIFSIFF